MNETKTLIIDSADGGNVIKPKKPNLLLLVFMLFVLMPVLTYLRIEQISEHPDQWFNWYRTVFLIILWTLVICTVLFRRKLYRNITLKLTPEGLIKENTLYQWHEIDQFGIARAYKLSLLSDRKTIFWNYKPSSSHRRFSEKLLRILSGYDDGVSSSSYEVEATELVKILNDWKTRYSGQSKPIINKDRLNRQITTRELISGILLAVFLIVFIVITIYLLRR